MTDTYIRLAQEVIPTGLAPAPSDTGIIVTGAANGTIIRHMRLVNKGAGPTTIKLWHTQGTAPAPDDISGSPEDVILPEAQIEPGGWAEFEGSIILNSGDRLYATVGVSAEDVTFTVYGLEMTP